MMFDANVKNILKVYFKMSALMPELRVYKSKTFLPFLCIQNNKIGIYFQEYTGMSELFDE